MEGKTLREVCNQVGVTRRAIQGYENAGLVESTGKNKYGYLLYDEITIERIKIIKQYQGFGFSIKEIKNLLQVPAEEYLKILEKRLMVMQLELKQLEMNFRTLEGLILEKRQ